MTKALRYVVYGREAHQSASLLVDSSSPSLFSTNHHLGVSLGGLLFALASLEESSSRHLSGSPTGVCRVFGVSIALTSKMSLSTATTLSGRWLSSTNSFLGKAMFD
ncbi:hypothetical protein F2Q69_00040058 [Brassica cretica]|uniref:Uncharacterized protein n=1 Tax=Brassica cretica TaxID=69181 RepID=A0A8S9NHH3_BRACR|nr:hypothetical protein F2Q69_00040058 [Brassica cretica]